MIKLPGDNGWVQNNRGDSLGTLQDTFNANLAANVGKVRTTRAKRVAYTGSPTGFGEVAALERFLTSIYVASENASAHDIWIGGNSPFNALTNDTTSVEINPINTDLKAWNSGLYIATGNEIYYTTDGAAWSEIGSNVLSNSTAHLLTDLNDVLYVSNLDYKVQSITSGNTFQSSGSQTLDLNLPGYAIQMLIAGIDRIWVGLSNIDGSSPSYVFEWNGVAENAPDARYEIQASAIMAGIVKDGVPYLVDSLGRLMVFTGGIFQEIARFPLNGRTFKGFNLSNNNSRAIHPRGMAVDGDEILICVANRTDEITDDDYNEFPSGVWAYSDTNGLYHKYSPSYQAVADTGTTNLTDYGQYRCFAGGPMMVVESVAVGGDATPTNGGRVLFSMEYFTDADDTSSDTEWGLFTDDTADDTQKGGYIVTPRIRSSQFRDTWEKIYTAISDLETSGDLVEIKYRTKDQAPTYVTATWTGTDRFNTSTDLSAYEQLEEVMIVQGKGSGGCYTIRTIDTGAGSSVVLDRDVTGVTVGQTSKVRVENWQRVGKVTDVFDKGFSIGKSDHWIQIKLFLQWTGPRELYDILIKNLSSLS